MALVVGGLFKLHDIVLLHGALSFGAAPARRSRPWGPTIKSSSIFFETRLGADLIFLNTEPVEGRG